jgi:hypothetical protein
VNPDRLRWTDSRLDDRFLDQKEDIDRAFQAVREVAAKLDTYIENEDKRRAEDRRAKAQATEERRKERKTDRRWIIGTVLTSAGLIIAAMALIGHIG